MKKLIKRLLITTMTLCLLLEGVPVNAMGTMDGAEVVSVTSDLSDVTDTVVEETASETVSTNDIILLPETETVEVEETPAEILGTTSGTDDGSETISTSYTLKLNTNKGSAVSAEASNLVKKGIKLSYNTKYSLPDADSFFRAGYALTGFCTKSSVTTKDAVFYPVNTEISKLTTKNSGTVTLYAVWEMNIMQGITVRKANSDSVESYGNIYPLQTISLMTETTPYNAYGTITWSVSDKKLASVNSKGVVSIKVKTVTEPTNVTIYATYKKSKTESIVGSYVLTILPSPIAEFTGIEGKDRIDLDYYEDSNKGQYEVQYVSEESTNNSTTDLTGLTAFTWSVNNTKLATIDSNTGSLTALKAGTVTVKATVTLSNGKKKSISKKVKIVNVPKNIAITNKSLVVREGKANTITLKMAKTARDSKIKGTSTYGTYCYELTTNDCEATLKNNKVSIPKTALGVSRIGVRVYLKEYPEISTEGEIILVKKDQVQSITLKADRNSVPSYEEHQITLTVIGNPKVNNSEYIYSIEEDKANITTLNNNIVTISADALEGDTVTVKASVVGFPEIYAITTIKVTKGKEGIYFNPMQSERVIDNEITIMVSSSVNLFPTYKMSGETAAYDCEYSVSKDGLLMFTCGVIYGFREGDTVFTAKTKDGATTSIKVHVIPYNEKEYSKYKRVDIVDAGQFAYYNKDGHYVIRKRSFTGNDAKDWERSSDIEYYIKDDKIMTKCIHYTFDSETLKEKKNLTSVSCGEKENSLMYYDYNEETQKWEYVVDKLYFNMISLNITDKCTWEEYQELVFKKQNNLTNS